MLWYVRSSSLSRDGIQALVKEETDRTGLHLRPGYEH